MDWTLLGQAVFVAGASVAVLALAAAAFTDAPFRLLAGAAALDAALALVAWIAYVVQPDTAGAVAAAGATVAALTTLASLRLRSLAARLRQIDDELADAEQRLIERVDREASARGAELERTLARARADSASLLTEQERRLSEERRRTAAERERELGAELNAGLARAQQQMEARLRAWTEDLDRTQHAIDDQLAHLAQRQRQLIADAEMRIAADAERLEAESEQQRAGLVRLRDDLARAIQEAVSGGTSELDTYAAERRRALHDMNERIRRRERALAEQIEREEVEATRRVQSAYSGVERRQAEQLDRQLSRATSSYSDAAAQQFSEAIKSAREDAAVRLSRELDRSVQAFAREAERVLAERLAHVGDAGAARLEKRLNQIAAGLERQRAEAISGFEERLAGAEHELRRRVEGFMADTDAERAVLEARLHDLARRIDEAIARA